MNIKLEPKEFLIAAKRFEAKLQRYFAVIFIVSILGVYSFLVFQISNASKAEPQPDALTSQLNTVKRLRVDQQSIDKIQQLEDQNVGVQSLFESARDNPFQDE